MVVQNYHLINITPEDLICADTIAQIRELYEFQRTGYLYSYNNSPKSLVCLSECLKVKLQSNSNIATGILAEILIYKDLSLHLKQKHINSINSIDFQKNMINEKFSYNLTIGKYDGGYDFLKNTFKIDVKNYGTRIFNNLNDILNFNLFVDKKQCNNSIPYLYIQSFLYLDSINSPYLVVAGYAKKSDLAPKNDIPNPAMCCSVKKLRTYENLKQVYFK